MSHVYVRCACVWVGVFSRADVPHLKIFSYYWESQIRGDFIWELSESNEPMGTAYYVYMGIVREGGSKEARADTR